MLLGTSSTSDPFGELVIVKWAATWQNQQNECASSEDSDQPGQPPSLISIFADHMKKAWVLSYPLGAQRRLWSDWADAQADLSLRWAHSHFIGFVMSRLKYILRALKTPHFTSIVFFFFFFFFFISAHHKIIHHKSVLIRPLVLTLQWRQIFSTKHVQCIWACECVSKPTSVADSQGQAQNGEKEVEAFNYKVSQR